jgi:hypothetical protein
MIRHIVLIRFAPEISKAAIADMFDQLHAIKDKIDGVLAITAGTSESPEKIERGYMHGFVVDFTDWAALQAYQDHPEHKAFGSQLVAAAVGGIEGILVFDLPIA